MLLFLMLAHSAMIIVSLAAVEQTVSIERFDRKRDFKPIQKLIANDAVSLLKNFDRLKAPEIERRIGCYMEQYVLNPAAITQVLRVNHETVGFVNALEQNITVLRFTIDRYGQISFFVVARGHRNKGYGRQLLQRAIEELESSNIARIDLAMPANHATAQNMCIKEGFTQQKVITRDGKQLAALYRKHCATTQRTALAHAIELLQEPCCTKKN